LTRLDDALALALQLRGELSFLHRLRGDILLKRDPSNPSPAEDAYRTAISIATQQNARSYGLLASLALAKLYQSTTRPVDAHAILAPALEGFSPTREMPEIAEAQVLLAELAGTKEVKTAEGQRQRRLDLQTAYGHALMWSKGFAAEETAAAFARIEEFAGPKENAAARFAAFYAQCQSNFIGGQSRLARETAESFLREADAEGRVAEACFAQTMLGVILLNQGELKSARSVLDRALADWDPRRDGEAGSVLWDAEVGATAFLAAVQWHLGDTERARELINRAVRRAEELGTFPNIVLALNWRAVLESQRHDVLATRNAAEAVIAVAEKHGVPHFAEHNWMYAHWAHGRLHDPQEGADRLMQALAIFTAHGNKIGAPFYQGLLSELEATTKGFESALAVIDHALKIAEETGEHLCDPYLHGLRGDLLLRRDPSNPGPAEEAFQTAIAIAKQQGARSWGLRAALSLTKLCQSTGRIVEAHAVLAPALEGFTPTPEMPEIAEAQASLAALAETEEVKAAETQRQRRLHLQTAYGQAMMWSKGFAAEETKAALARAAELTERTDNFSERVIALQGQFSAAATAGELRSARELALTLLREAEGAKQRTEASMAENFLGLVAYWRGDFVEARTRCERVLDARRASPDPKDWGPSDDDGTHASSLLALAIWQLGEVERARELIDWSTRRAAEIGQIPTGLIALFYKSYFELWRGDPLATLSAAKALEVVARDHGAMQYLNEAELHSGWARGRMNDPMAGAAEMRRVLAAFVEQGVRVNLGFYTGLLAQLQAETLEAESALTRIDEAFRLSNAVEHGCSLPFLHRLRGEILLKPDPADIAPAEEAFRTSIAIAKEQSARSPVLLASLALAKLLQSTGRFAEAHGVLTAALESFSPTPEMRQIAEAQALLVALAETEEVKSAALSRHRRLRLQTSLSQAMMHSRGFASDESKTAVARALTLAAGVENASERFDAYYGLCVGCLVRGELALAWETAESFLRDAENEGRVAEASIAHRNLGRVRLYQGDFIGAELSLTEALSRHDPTRDRDTKFRFGGDSGATAVSYLTDLGGGRCRAGAGAGRGGVGARGRDRSRAHHCERLLLLLHPPNAPRRPRRRQARRDDFCQLGPKSRNGLVFRGCRSALKLGVRLARRP
jgi:tetratricopeptide (TPR) repeat protein